MIVVTGASRGLGAAICRRLVENGRPVVGLARNVAELPFDSYSCDVSSYEEVRAVAQKIKKSGKAVTGLINAAGIASMNLAMTTPPATTQRIVQTNLVGTIYCCQAFAPFMLRQKSGGIINFSTIAVALGLEGESIYAASKAGVEAFSRVFAKEMGSFNVRVNCIAPGPIDTDLLKGISAEQIGRIVARQAIPKQFLPTDICDIVELLLDDRSGALSGQILHVGGV